jgi:hypothetical protein
MTLKQYLYNLNKLLKQFPEAASLTVYYSSDDEGNSYEPVRYIPILEYIDDNGIIDRNDWEEHGIIEPNAIIIN